MEIIPARPDLAHAHDSQHLCRFDPTLADQTVIQLADAVDERHILIICGTKVMPEATVHEDVRNIPESSEGLELKEIDQERKDILRTDSLETFRGAIHVFINFLKALQLVVVFITVGHRSPDVLHDFKSYASRTLNRGWGKPVNGTWWTGGGSKRKLPNEEAVRHAVQYVRDQEFPLVVWVNEEFMSRFGERGQSWPR